MAIAIPGACSLKIVNDPVSPLTKANITALGATLTDADFNGITFPNIAVSIDRAIIGPGGLDVGPAAFNQTYYFYLISDGVNVAGLASLSHDNVVLPPGFTYCCYITAWVTGGAGNWFPMMTAGKRTSLL